MAVFDLAVARNRRAQQQRGIAKVIGRRMEIADPAESRSCARGHTMKSCSVIIRDAVGFIRHFPSACEIQTLFLLEA